MWVAEFFHLAAVADPKFGFFPLPAVTDPKFGLFKHVLGFARIIYTLCPNSCRQTARIGGAAAPLPPRPVRLCIAICVMPRRRKTDYVAVYQELCVILPQWQVKRIVLDLEEATWRAV